MIQEDYEVTDDLLTWGHFKPHLIHSISQRNIKTHNPITFNLGYMDPHNSASLKLMFRDKNDESVHFDFVENDGATYSLFEILEPGRDMKL